MKEVVGKYSIAQRWRCLQCQQRLSSVVGRHMVTWWKHWLATCNSIHTLQSRDYHGYLEGKRRQNGDEQRPARGIAARGIAEVSTWVWVAVATKTWWRPAVCLYRQPLLVEVKVTFPCLGPHTLGISVVLPPTACPPRYLTAAPHETPKSFVKLCGLKSGSFRCVSKLSDSSAASCLWVVLYY